MLRARSCTRLFKPLGTILRPEKPLRFAIRCNSANRIVSSHGRDDDVAVENVAISTGAPHVHLFRWLALAHDIPTQPCRLSSLSYAAASCRLPTRDGRLDRCGTASSNAFTRAG